MEHGKTMDVRVRVVLLGTLLGAACGAEHKDAHGGAGQEAVQPRDAAQVLNALVDLWYEEPFIDERSQSLFLRAETSAERGESWAKVRQQLEKSIRGLRPETLDAFEQANATPMDLRKVLNTTHTVHFVDVNVLKETLGSTRNSHEYDVALRELLAQHPDSRQLVSLSVPGLSPDGKEALLYATERRGARMAAGYYFLLAREDGAWRVLQKYMAWIS